MLIDVTDSRRIKGAPALASASASSPMAVAQTVASARAPIAWPMCGRVFAILIRDR